MNSQQAEWAFKNQLLIQKHGCDVIVPLSLRPTRWPLHLYQEAMTLQPIFNQLVLTIVKERQWLLSICEKLAKSDPFVQKLLSIWLKAPKPDIICGIFRSDYMIHNKNTEDEEEASLKQVELNTIAASFPALAERVARFHRECLGHDNIACSNIPDMAKAMDQAASLKLGTTSYEQCCIIMVVQPNEGNIYDQMALVDSAKTPIHRLTLLEIGKECKLDSDHNLLLNDILVAVVYFRAAYAPHDFFNEECDQARLLIEQSGAVKIPDLGCQLAGLKKVQQELANEENLRKFITGAKERRMLQKVFVELYSLDEDEEGDLNAQKVYKNPEKWVIKPQREGGGNNIYGADTIPFLDNISRRERSSHILMEKINASCEELSLVRESEVWTGSSISEMGIYGIILESDTISYNKSAGYLVRSKPANVNEGGVATGYAYLNSLILEDGNGNGNGNGNDNDNDNDNDNRW